MLASLHHVLQRCTAVPLQLVPTDDAEPYHASSSDCVEKPSSMIRFSQHVLADRLEYLTLATSLHKPMWSNLTYRF